MTDIEIIQNPREGIERAWSFVEKSEYEVLSVFATPNAFRRQMDMGLLQLLNQATEQRHVQVRILIPADKQIKDTIDQAAKICPLVDFRVAEENLQTRITIVLIDKKDCMIVELGDDSKDSSYYAAGLATYVIPLEFQMTIQPIFMKSYIRKETNTLSWIMNRIILATFSISI